MTLQAFRDRICIQLVEGWKSAWRWWSMWMHVIGTALFGILMLVPSMPAEVQALVPIEYRAIAIGIWAILGVLVRVIQQKPKQE